MPVRAKIFYGWWVVAGLVVVGFINAGVRFAIGPFLKPIVADLGLDRGSVSLVVALSLFLYGAFMPVVGRLVDRHDPRLIITGAGLFLGVALALTGLSTNLWHLTLSYGLLVSLGLAGTGNVVLTAIAGRWFVRRRGLALSMLQAASMGGMTLFTPLVVSLILWIGWRWTYGVMAMAIVVLVIPLSLAVVRGRPEEVGLFPDGEPAAPPFPPGGKSERTDLLDAARSRPFWQLIGGFFGCGLSMNLLASHGVPMLTDHGFHPMTAAFSLSVLGMAAIVGGLCLGALSDRWGRKGVLAGIYFVRGIGFFLLFAVTDTTALYLLAILGGLGWSGSGAMTSALTADLYGRFSVGTIYGTIFLAHQVGGALGAYVGGLTFDLTGSYAFIFMLAGSVLLLASLLSVTIPEREGRARHAVVAAEL
jgi:MFS family permease